MVKSLMSATAEQHSVQSAAVLGRLFYRQAERKAADGQAALYEQGCGQGRKRIRHVTQASKGCAQDELLGCKVYTAVPRGRAELT